MTTAFKAAQSGQSGQAENGFVLPKKPKDPPSRGMVAWFKSEDAGSVWLSSVGGFEGRSIKSRVVRRIGAGFGADRPVTYIQGTDNGAYSFGKILKPDHTVCSVTRYTGGGKDRILQIASGEWLHGHHQKNVGVAWYKTAWLTAKERNPKGSMDWVVLCGTNGAKRAYDSMTLNLKNVAEKGTFGKFSSTQEIFVNKGSGAKTDFGVMELITWDRVLTEQEMKDSVQYLKWKLRAGAVLEVSERLAPESLNNFWRFGQQDRKGVSQETFEATLANGYKAAMTKWTHLRPYAKGFIRRGGACKGWSDRTFEPTLSLTSQDHSSFHLLKPAFLIFSMCFSCILLRLARVLALAGMMTGQPSPL